jgi:DNA-binding CsgD family transcriptional regulator
MLYDYSEQINNLNLSTRSYNTLKREGIDTIIDLLKCSKKDILEFRGLGNKSLNEIFYIIDELNNKKEFIDYESKTKVPSQKKTFIHFDGHKYYDIPLEDMKLTVRAFNCLKAAKLNYYSELIYKSADELIAIPNMGKKSLLEVESVKCNISLKLSSDTEDNQNITTEIIARNIFESISKKINVNPVRLYQKLTPICLVYMENKEYNEDSLLVLEDKNFLKYLYELDYIQTLLKEYILSIIKNSIYGCDKSNILENMPIYFNNSSFVNFLLNELLIDNKIQLFENDKYIAVYPSFVIGAKKFLTDKEYEILIQRTEGKTLEEIGKNNNLTRERIRQIEAKAVKKINKKSATFKEDIYSDVFKRYFIDEESFIIAFNNNQTYNYLSLLYSPKSEGAKCSKFPLDKILEDTTIPILFKKAFEKVIYKDYVQIGKEYISCSRDGISNYVLKNFATDAITFKEFNELYFSILDDIHKLNDPKLSLMERGYENKLSASTNVLWKYGKKFRYYNMASYDFTDLLKTLNLEQYQNVEYSTLKFFRLYPELMKTYDIHDEYELHNLLKKIVKKEEYPEVNFRRMPNIEFGKADRSNQVLDMLLSLAPITNNEFAKEYEEEYGVAENTVLANYMPPFNQYYHDGIYKIDFPDLSNIMAQRLKELLCEDFYFLSTIKKIYIQEFPKSDVKLLNPFSIKNLGFKVYSNYAIKDKFNSATEYFNYLLTKDDITYTINFPNKVNLIISYTTQLYKLKGNYEIIEFSPNKFLNFRKLQEFGITKDMLRSYCDDVLKFVGTSKYFTLHSLRVEGFSHELDRLGFDDWFYTSILTEDNLNFSYQKLGENKLMLCGKFNVKFEDFLEFIVYNQDSFSIDIYELIYMLRSYYNISVNISKIREIVKNSTMFYDAVSEKIYADYDTYYEEI